MAGLLLGACSADRSDEFRQRAQLGVTGLRQWYVPPLGLWSGTHWWNAANALTTTIDYVRRTGDRTDYALVAKTFDTLQAIRIYPNFINDYYDDEGWWALAWINAYDLTGEARYLKMAQLIFDDLTTGWDDTCGGGIWWRKDRTYKNAISNELFLTVAARLHRRTAGAGSYLSWAQRTWGWLERSGMIEARSLINDGLDPACKSVAPAAYWTYNQGVILGGLVDLAEGSGVTALLTQAEAIADAAIATMTDGNGVLKERCEPDCGDDGPQFKGIFMRNLAYLGERLGTQRYHDFLVKNADFIWDQDRAQAEDGSETFGLRWSGPFDVADPARQSSALDALVGVIPDVPVR